MYIRPALGVNTTRSLLFQQHLLLLRLTKKPYNLVAVDFVLLPPTARGNVGCLVLVDHGFKWLSNKQAKTVATAFEYRILPILASIPLRLLSDNGHEFTAREFEEVLNKYGIQHIYSSPYKPAFNRAVERVNRTIIEMVRGMGEESALAWDENLSKVVISHNNCWHSQIAMSPSQFLLGKVHAGTPSVVVFADTRQVWKEEHPFFKTFRLEGAVLQKVNHPGNLTTNKIKPRYRGPYQISGVHSRGLAYEVSPVAFW